MDPHCRLLLYNEPHHPLPEKIKVEFTVRVTLGDVPPPPYRRVSLADVRSRSLKADVPPKIQGWNQGRSGIV